MRYQIIRLSLVAKMLGLSRSTIWRRLNDDATFPRPLRLGSSRRSAIGFIQSEIEAWLEKSAQLRQNDVLKGE